MICKANRLTDFYKSATLAFNGLKSRQNFCKISVKVFISGTVVGLHLASVQKMFTANIFRATSYTVWKVSVFGVFLVRIFPHLDTFQAVLLVDSFETVQKICVKIYSVKYTFTGKTNLRNCLDFVKKKSLAVRVWKILATYGKERNSFLRLTLVR